MAPAVQTGGIVGQVGGHASQVIKLLVAGAGRGWLVTPMLEEAVASVHMAELAGVADRFRAVVAVAEGAPFAGPTFDAILSGGSLHHIQVRPFGRELNRILRPAGVYGAWDPWRSPLYRIGIAVFGKRDPQVHCQPLESGRFRDLEAVFDGTVDLRLYSPVMRYLLLALWKLKMPISISRALRIFEVEERIARRTGPAKRLASSSAVLLRRA